MKKFFAFLSVVLCLCMLTACAGTPVIYHMNCDCPEAGNNNNGGNGNNNNNNGGNNNTDTPLGEGELKTGVAIIAGIGKSTSATADESGKADYDITMAAVLVDKDGIIRACVLDAIATSLEFNNAGTITSDLTKAVSTKNELGDNYSMPSGSWKAQAEAISAFAVGKTAAQFRQGAVDATGKAPAGSDLASQATFYIGTCVSAIEKAAANAQNLGAKMGDTLRFASLSSVGSSANVGEDDGLAELDVDATALTMKDGKITSCMIDAVQAKVSFDASGTITTAELSSAVKTKNELGADYKMVEYGQAIAEWNVQTAAFAKYITGKTPEEVAGIAIQPNTKPTEDSDLYTSVTISIGGFQALIAKAAQ